MTSLRDIEPAGQTRTAGRFARLSIRWKLVVIFMVVSTSTVLFSGVMIIAYQVRVFRQRMVDDLLTQAQMLADNCQAALAFEDPYDANMILQSLDAVPRIAYACVKQKDGREFTAYRRADFTGDPQPEPGPRPYLFENGWLVVSRPIILNEESIGSIFIQSDLRESSRYLRQSILALTVAVLMAMVVAYALSSRLQKVISRPILHLTQTVGVVSEKRDYSVRAVRAGEDELGLLTDTFNEMLTQIQARDLALREREERFRRYFELGVVGMAYTSAEKGWIEVNDRLCEMFGYTKEEFWERTWAEMTHPDDLESDLRQFNRVLAGEIDGYSMDKRYLTKDGEVIHTIKSFRGMRESDGTMDYGIVLIQDITDRKRAEEELRRYRDQLEDLVRERTRELEEVQEKLIRKERLAALGQLTATVSHEIRNPLGTVRTSVFSIGDALERKEYGRVGNALRLAERNIRRCDRIIAELLDFTRPRTLRLEPLSIDKWLGDVLDEYEFPDGIGCRRTLHSDARIPVDREHLRRAVINIVTNAAQAMQEEDSTGRELAVETEVRNGRLEMRFVDTGPGIPKDQLEKIFEPLFSTKSFGIGLGLSIVKDIIEEHGGGIEVSSKSGSGTTVLLWLPARKESRGEHG